MPMILRSGRIASIELAPVVLNAPDITAGQFLKFLDRVLLGIQEMLRAINDCYDSKEARSLKSGTTKRAQYLAPFKSISDEIRRLVTTVGFYKQSAIEWHTG